jgi:adenine-specific DNA-methyltransferase
MPELVWVGKDKVVNHHHAVPFRILDKRYTFGAAANRGNRIVHGDNLAALKSLLPEYEGRVKCVYIDPPYNTGNESWVYNDNVNDPKMKKWLGQVVGKEGEDLSRHDKWLCMMYPRLKLLRKLLSDDGVIFISIDDNEQANLKLIMDEIFGRSNFVVNMIWQKMDSPSSNARERAFSLYHDHTLVYSKTSKAQLKQLSKPEILNAYPEESESGKRFRLRQLRKNGKAAKRSDRPKMYFEMIAPDGTSVLPVHPQEKWEGRWAIGKEKYDAIKDSDEIKWVMRDTTWTPYSVEWASEEPSIPNPSILTDAGQNRQAKAELNAILGTDHNFDTPKPSTLIERILQIATDKDSIVLDSFAGSGTTAHAVLKLNKADGGNRKFILIETEDYAETITAERVRRVMNGYGEAGKAVEGLGGAFDYYEIGEPLFTEDGNLNESVGAEEIRRYVAYSENLAAENQLAIDNEISPYLLGIKDNAAYFFYYEPTRATTLDLEFLSRLKMRPSEIVFYADVSLLNKEQLQRYKIIFKKIPRDITRF